VIKVTLEQLDQQALKVTLEIKEIQAQLDQPALKVTLEIQA
jgi:hypothetical protein